MSVKFGFFVHDAFRGAVSKLVKFEGFLESERLAILRVLKKVSDEEKTCLERVQEIQSNKELAPEDSAKKLDELSQCESQIEPSLDYHVVKKASLSIADLIALKPLLQNVPEELA